MEEKQFTLRDLKEFVLSLTEEQLDQPMLLSPEEAPITGIYPVIMEADFYYNTYEPEDCGYLDELKQIYEDLGDEFKIEDFEIAYKKGTVLFYDEQS